MVMFCYEPGCMFWVLMFIYELQPISVFSSDPHIPSSSLNVEICGLVVYPLTDRALGSGCVTLCVVYQ